MDQPVVFEQRILRIEDHGALQLLPAQPRAFVKLADLSKEVRRDMRGIVARISHPYETRPPSAGFRDG
jgi:hypothetical protein